MVEYAHVPEAERSETLTVERDLVIAEAFGAPLYRPAGVAVADDGTIYVLDAGNHRVVSFDDAGTPIAQMGQQGQGPGEFQSARYLAVWDDGIIVYDSRNARFSIFARDGTLLREVAPETRVRPNPMRQDGENLLAVNSDPSFVLFEGQEPTDSYWRVGLYALDGTELGVLAEFLKRTEPTQWQGERAAGTIPLRPGWPVEALDTSAIYYSDGLEYQVHAIDHEGAPLWSLRTDYVPTPVGDEAKRRTIASTRERHPELTASNFQFPTRYAAIDNMALDGAGNLYVSPHTPRWPEIERPAEQQPEQAAIDVYTADGERLFAGTISIEGWQAAHGEHVYRIEEDADSGEQVLARYRLAIPGAR